MSKTFDFQLGLFDLLRLALRRKVCANCAAPLKRRTARTDLGPGWHADENVDGFGVERVDKTVLRLVYDCPSCHRAHELSDLTTWRWERSPSRP